MVDGKGNPRVAANVTKIVGAIGYMDIAAAMKKTRMAEELSFVPLPANVVKMVEAERKNIR